MSQYSTEHDPGIVTDEPGAILVTDLDPVGDQFPGHATAPEGSDGAQGKAADVKDAAKDAGQHVADVAKDQAGNVAAEAKSQARDLLSQGQDELKQQTAQQQARVAGGLRSLSDELHSMANGSTESGLATDLAREAADRTQAVATWLDDREPGQLLDDVKSFARQRPGTFLGLAAVAGVLVGRLGRGLKEGEPQ